jgi:hypothetical protein
MLAGKSHLYYRFAESSCESKADQTYRTNTDGVIIDPTQSHEENRGIVAWYDGVFL